MNDRGNKTGARSETGTNPDANAEEPSTFVRTEQALADFVDSAAVGLHWVAPDGTILWANKSDYEPLGYTAEEYVGRNIADFHADPNVIDDILRRLASGECIRDYDARLRAKDGSIRYVQITSSVRFDDRGEFVHTRCFTRDITERRRAEDQVRHEREMLRLITDAAPVLISFVSGDGRYRFVNRAYEEWFGVPNHLIVGRTMRELVGDAGYETIRGYVERALSGEAVTYEASIPYVRGGQRSVRASYVPHLDRHGKVDGFAVLVTDTTEQLRAQAEREELLRRAEEARRQAEAERENLHAILTQAPGQIGVFSGPDHVVEFVNPATRQLLGHRELGRPLREMIPDLESGLLETVDHVYRTGQSVVRQEAPVTLDWKNDGHPSTRYFNLAFAPRLHASGGVQGVVTFNFDVTEQVQARKRSQDSERRATLLAEAIPQIVWATSADGVVEYVNRRWTEYTGQTLEQTRRNWVQALHPEDVQRLTAAWQTAIASARQFQLQIRYLRARDATYRWHLALVVPLCDEHGNVLEWIGTATDIEDQRRSDDAIRFMADASTLLGASLDYEQTLKSVAAIAVPGMADWVSIHLLTDGELVARRLVTAHVDPIKVAWAEELERRYPPDRNAPRGVYEVIRSGQPELYPDIPDEMLSAAAKDPEHLQILRQVGFRSVMIVPLRVRGRPIGAMSFISAESGRRYDAPDLTMAQELADRVAQAVENARLYEEAQQAVRARDDFLSIASHELRTPLTSINLQLEMLERNVLKAEAWPGRDKLLAKIQMIDRQVERLSGLVSDLLDVSRAVAGRFALELERVDLASVVQEAAGRLNEHARRAGSELVVQTSECIGEWDKLRLDQVITNLVTNALKFGAQKPVEVRVDVTPAYGVLRVRDHGIGIAPENQARIFERFERAVSKRHFGGLGLGLWIVRQIVEALGGTIAVNSKPGQGSEFVVTLPRGDGASGR